MLIMETFKRIIKLKRLFLLLLFPAGLLLLDFAKKHPEFTEHVFARGFFKIYSQIFSNITGLFPFSLAEFGICLGIFLIPAIVIIEIILVIKRKGSRIYMIVRDILTVAGIASLAYFLLVVGCSVNYYRYTFGQIAGFDVHDSSVDELKYLCDDLAAKASELRAKVGEDENGVYRLSFSKHALGEKCREAYKNLAKVYPETGGLYPRPKCVIHSTLMSMAEFTGVYVPFTMEANVNIDAPDYSIASTMCHELAHLRGFIREDEANYIAYLACMASDDVELQYSGVVEALLYAGNALAGKDYEAYCAMRAGLHPGINRDYAANSEYWKQYEKTVISETANEINDTYLKQNDQEDGVQSYGRVVDLLLAEQRKRLGELVTPAGSD